MPTAAGEAPAPAPEIDSTQVPCCVADWVAALGSLPSTAAAALAASAKPFLPVPVVGQEVPEEEKPALDDPPQADDAPVAARAQPPEARIARSGPKETLRQPSGTVSQDARDNAPAAGRPEQPAPAKSAQDEAPQAGRKELADLSSQAGGRAEAELPASPAARFVTDGTHPIPPELALNSQARESGMSAAPQAATMPASIEVNEITAPEEQKMPGTDAAVVAAPVDPRERKTAGAASETDPVTSSAQAEPGMATVSATQGPAAHTEASPPRTEAAEAVHRAIDSAAAGLGRAEGGSVSVILRPDANTQLALHVKVQQGHIEALAVVEHGDFTALGADWTRLQSRLAEQGVRLAPLVPASDHSTSLLGGGSHRSGQERQPERPAPATRELNPPAASRTQSPTPAVRRAPAAGHREWWA